MAIASASKTMYMTCGLPIYLFVLYSLGLLYSIFILCILSPGRVIKKVGRDVMDRDFCIYV